MSDDYNYAHFEMAEDFRGFAEGKYAPIGSMAPDGALTDAASGVQVSLSEYWRKGPLAMEIGSYT